MGYIVSTHETNVCNWRCGIDFFFHFLFFFVFEHLNSERTSWGECVILCEKSLGHMV
jgi:hypothetical protein